MPREGAHDPSPAEWVRDQVTEYERSGRQWANTSQDTGLAVIIVSTRGRMRGKVRKTPLMRVEYGGEFALVASKGGASSHPVWYLNLVAHPTAVAIQDGAVPFDAVAREVRGEERSLWWDRAVAAYPPYAEYQANTARQIPVMVGSPAGGGPPGSIRSIRRSSTQS